MTTPTPPPAPGSTVTLDKAKLATILASILALVLSVIALVNGDGTGSSASSSSPPVAVSSSSAPASPSSTAVARGCLAQPSACGYPDATNTGVPANVVLTVHPGKLVTDHDGQVIENLDIQGCVQVKNAGVIIRDTRIEGGCLYSLDLSKATGHTDVSDTTVVGTQAQLATAVIRNATLTRVEVSGGNDGIDAWGGAGGANVVQDSYIHGLIRSADGLSHDDTLQISGGDETFRHNTLLPLTGTDPMNACLQIGALQGTLDQLTFADNLCNGGNYSINANNSGVGSTITAGPLKFTDNRFGTGYRYGVKAHLGTPFATTWTGNVDDATGQLIP